MKKILSTFLALSLIFLLACSNNEGQNTNGQEGNSQTDFALGDFQTQDMSGQSFDNSIFADYELTLVNVWGTWCPPCVGEIPDLGELAKELQDEGINIIGLIQDVVDPNTLKINEEILDTAIDIMSTSNAEYTVLLPDQIILSNFLQDIYSFPTTIFVDKNGKQVGEPVRGAKSKAQWSTIIYQYKEMLG